MTPPIILRPAAEDDLRGARDWYQEQRPGLGVEFMDEVSAAMTHLALHPELSPPYYRSFRRILLHRFPYKIFYQVLQDRIVIFRVLHAKQTHGPKLR